MHRTQPNTNTPNFWRHRHTPDTTHRTVRNLKHDNSLSTQLSREHQKRIVCDVLPLQKKKKPTPTTSVGQKKDLNIHVRLPRVVRGGYVEKPWWTNLSVSPRPCFKHLSMGQACNPPTPRDTQHSVCSPCSRAHFGRLPTACVSSPRDWTVHIGSHMQQDTCISPAPPHPCAPCPSFLSVHPKKWRSFLLRQLSFVQRVFSTPRGASCTVIVIEVVLPGYECYASVTCSMWLK